MRVQPDLTIAALTQKRNPSHVIVVRHSVDQETWEGTKSLNPHVYPPSMNNGLT